MGVEAEPPSDSSDDEIHMDVDNDIDIIAVMEDEIQKLTMDLNELEDPESDGN